MSPIFNLCPYTLRPLAELTTSREHVFPLAIGGDRGFGVVVDRVSNSKFGDGLDAKFLNSHVIRALRTKYGIHSSSGPPTWEIKGKTGKTDQPVSVTFDKNRKKTVKYFKPVTVNAVTGEKIVFGTAEQVNKHSEQIIQSMRKEGYASISVKGTKVPREPFQLDFSEDMDVIRQGLLKIVFLAAYHFLGDAWLNDPLFPEWQRALSSDPADARKAKIPGAVFQGHRTFKATQPYEHAIAIFYMPNYGIQSSLRLFGSDLLSGIFTVSLSRFDLNPLDGEMTICNAQKRQSVTGAFLSIR